MTREEAIEKVRQMSLPKETMEILEALAPELCESEDERIRKDIINLIYWLKANPSLCSQYYKDRYDSILAWLEKQKDVKVKYVYPKFRIGDIISYNKPEPGFINDYTIVGFNNEMPDYLVDGGNVPSCSIGIEFIDSNYHLKEQQPADLSKMMVHKEPYIAPVPTPMVADEQKPAEWSKEDENKIKDIIDYLECWNDFDHGSESFEEYRKRMEGNIQFMKSLRPSWKPSEQEKD